MIANCGYGHGYSVREVIASVEKIAGLKLDVREEPRRAGDPPSLVARAQKVREVFGWSPKLDDIDVIVRSSLEWERRLQREPW
jgi:UDP-glucose 4-epimerase